MNVQLAEYEGKLQELYILIVDGKHPRRIIRTLPAEGIEVSRDVIVSANRGSLLPQTPFCGSVDLYKPK